MSKKIKKSKLFMKTLELYENRSIKLTNEIIADKTGIGYPWIIKFAKMDEPSVDRLEVMYEFLSGKELQF